MIDVSKIEAAFNKIVSGTRGKIYSQLMSNMEVKSPLYELLKRNTKSGFKDGTYYVGVNSYLSEVLQAWQKTKTSKGGIEFIPNEIRQKRHMIYIDDISPDDVVKVLEAMDMFDETKEPTDQDIVLYIIDQVTRKANEDRLYEQLYRGKYVAPTSGVAGPAQNSIDGFGEILEAGLEETDPNKKINNCDIGIIDLDLAYEQLKDFGKQIPEKYRTRPMNAFVSDDVKIAFLEGRESAIGTHVNTNDKNPDYIPFTNIRLWSEPSMVGSKRIFTTPDWNLRRIIDKKTDLGNLRAKEFAIDLVTVSGHYHEAWGFEMNNFVWTNAFSNSGSGGGEENETYVD